ncbi:MAG TPA: HAMP domain-containing sensor histidine kinase [Streptosporangiaceae bacterium]|nr:HAMP domain-containing sensor histidine kinase [Streptosporangiaceae bacterium]
MVNGDSSPASAAPRGSPVGLRLALTFLGVALASIAVLASLVAAFAAADVSALTTRQRSHLTSAVAVAAAAAWDRNRSWESANLSPALDLAADTGADVQIRNRTGRAVASSPGFASAKSAPQYQAPIGMRGERVGVAVVRFTQAGIGGADNVLESDLLRAIAGAAGVAALLALVTGLALARRLTRPVERIIAVTQAMERGERTARVGPLAAPAELRDLATAFDRMADTLDRQEQLRRDLVADVAHELRTPVAVLQAGHEALLDGLAEPTPDQLASLRDEVLRLARMVGDLQTLAAADAAALHLSLRRCDLADIAAGAADSLVGRFDAAGITFERHLVPAEIQGDPRWLHQVVTNLLTNALKFTPAGGKVTITVGAAGPDAVLTVTDTGTGISEDELPRIFDRFWRGRRASQTSGSGIGLAIAAELALAHGGWLTASSEVDRGTEMRLTVPLA